MFKMLSYFINPIQSKWIQENYNAIERDFNYNQFINRLVITVAPIIGLYYLFKTLLSSKSRLSKALEKDKAVSEIMKQVLNNNIEKFKKQSDQQEQEQEQEQDQDQKNYEAGKKELKRIKCLYDKMSNLQLTVQDKRKYLDNIRKHMEKIYKEYIVSHVFMKILELDFCLKKSLALQQKLTDQSLEEKLAYYESVVQTISNQKGKIEKLTDQSLEEKLAYYESVVQTISNQKGKIGQFHEDFVSNFSGLFEIIPDMRSKNNNLSKLLNLLDKSNKKVVEFYNNKFHDTLADLLNLAELLKKLDGKVSLFINVASFISTGGFKVEHLIKKLERFNSLYSSSIELYFEEKYDDKYIRQKELNDSIIKAIEQIEAKAGSDQDKAIQLLYGKLSTVKVKNYFSNYSHHGTTDERKCDINDLKFNELPLKPLKPSIPLKDELATADPSSPGSSMVFSLNE